MRRAAARSELPAVGGRLRGMKRWVGAAAVVAAGCAPGKQDAPAAKVEAANVVVYTSLYQEVVEAVSPVLNAKLPPGVTVSFVQGGSGKIAKRLDEEIAKGAPGADVLLTADPAYFRALKAAGKLAAYSSPLAAKQPAEWKDTHWATARFTTMVIGLSPEVALDPKAKKPATWTDLGDPALTRVALGDPRVSGTTLTAVSALAEAPGWPLFESLAKKKAVSAGGSALVLQRLDVGDSDAGIVLLENLLAARAAGSKVGVVFPKDGAIVVPGPIALVKDSKAARAVYDAILSPEVQRVFVEQGFMHGADGSTPQGAPPLAELLAGKSAYAAHGDAEAVKQKFGSLFGGVR